MKQISIILIFILLLFSCSKDENVYSCDKEVNDYVADNINTLKSVSLGELSTYSNELQKAIYRSFSEQKRYEVWVERLDILANDDSFNSEEQMHIHNLQNQLNTELFSFNNTTAFNLFITFFDKWKHDAELNLGWDKSMILFITSSFSLYYSDFINDVMVTSYALVSGGECNCNMSADGCPGSTIICKSSGCSTIFGCGVLWLQNCDGFCASQD